MEYFIGAFRKYAMFRGRASRKEYWVFYLFYMLLLVGAAMLDAALDAQYVLYAKIALVTFLPMLAVSVRRLHDVDRSGWFLLVPVYSFILLVTDGTAGDNRFGPDPKFM